MQSTEFQSRLHFGGTGAQNDSNLTRDDIEHSITPFPSSAPSTSDNYNPNVDFAVGYEPVKETDASMSLLEGNIQFENTAFHRLLAYFNHAWETLRQSDVDFASEHNPTRMAHFFVTMASPGIVQLLNAPSHLCNWSLKDLVEATWPLLSKQSHTGVYLLAFFSRSKLSIKDLTSYESQLSSVLDTVRNPKKYRSYSQNPVNLKHRKAITGDDDAAYGGSTRDGFGERIINRSSHYQGFISGTVLQLLGQLSICLVRGL